MRSLFLFLISFPVCAFAYVTHKDAPPAPKVAPDMSMIDKRVDPCDDFYAYACGQWLKDTIIPADHPVWDRGFTEIAERNQTLLKSMLGGYAKGAKTPENPYAKKLGMFYGSCMSDEKDKTARPYLNKQLKTIDGLEREGLPAYLAWAHARGISAFFSFAASQDFKNPQSMIAQIDQGGMGLPSRDYYVDTSENMAAAREAYFDYLQELLKAIGFNNRAARHGAHQVMHLETKLAEASLSPVQFRDPVATYHKFAKPEAIASALKWPEYFKGLAITQPAEFNVSAPSYMKVANDIMATAPMSTLRIYLKVKTVEAASRALPGPIRDAFYGFYFKTLMGVPEIPPHWKRCVDATDEFMPFALGRSFIGKTYKGASKEQTQKLINNIEAQMGVLIDHAAWMDDTTRHRAHEKLDKLVNQIGYPDHWRSYDALKMGRSYLENRWAAIAFENAFQLDKIGKPVDRTEWYFSPSTVNAGYDPQMNRMQFPAGILQSPFFSSEFGDIANYGAIGMIMGHEISHAFDDEGAQFDSTGAMVDWWTPVAHAEFARRGKCLAAQYDRFPTEGGAHVNGPLTLGEDIGDQGGIKLALAAWKKTLKGEPSREDSQKFFLSFAQAFCGKETPAFEKMTVNTDPHPPDRYRVRGALMNLPEFAATYQCKEGSEMAPKVRCEVW